MQFLPIKTGLPGLSQSGLSDDDDVDYSIKLSKELNDQIIIYGGIAPGYKSSRWNMSRGSSPSQAELKALLAAGFTPPPYFTMGTRKANLETGEVYEIGAKMLFEQGSLNLN